ncbi:MAG: sugar-binding protein [Victivallales bacterium]
MGIISRRLSIASVFTVVLLCAANHLKAEQAVGETMLLKEDFDKPSDRWSASNGKIEDGKLVLRAGGPGRHNGSQFILNGSFQIPDSGNLKFSWKIGSIGTVEGKAVDAMLRIFIAPEPLAGFTEPYGMPDAIVLLLERRGDDKLDIYLSEKIKSGNGFGKQLYSASMPVNSFPFTISLTIGKDSYEVNVDKPSDRGTGLRAGSYAAGKSPSFAKGLKSGMRIVNDGDKESQAALEGVSVIGHGTPSSPSAEAKSDIPQIPVKFQPSPGLGQTRIQKAAAFPSYAIDAGGFKNVQPVFNVNVNGWTRDNADDLVKDLNLNGARLFLWPPTESYYVSGERIVAPHTPWAAAQYGGKPVGREEAFSMFDKWYKQDFKTVLDSIFPEILKKDKGGQFYQLELCRRWGLCDNLIFHSQVDGSADRNQDGVNAYYSAYIDAVRKYAPWCHLDYIQMTNEPNYPWWSGQFTTGKEASATWIRVYDRLNKFLLEKYPETRLIGPCLASSSFFSWQDWKTWTEPVLLNVAVPMKYYNYHMYDTGNRTNLAWMDMARAKALSVGRPAPQAIITETNFGLGDKSSEGQDKRFTWFAEQLFACLENPEKFHTFSLHLLCGQSEKYPINEAYLLIYRGDKLIPSSSYWVYRTLKHMRGQNIYIRRPADPFLRFAACSPTDDTLAVAVFNDSPEIKVLSLDSGIPADQIAETRLLSAYCQSGAVTHADDMLPGAPSSIDLCLPPYSVYSAVWKGRQPIVSGPKPLRRDEFYSKTAAAPFDKDIELSIATGREPVETETVSLRFSLSCDTSNLAGVRVSFNGNELHFLANEASHELTSFVRDVWSFERVVPASWVKKDNSLKFTLAGTPGILMSASLVYENHPDKTVAQFNFKERNSIHLGQINAYCLPFGFILDGDTKDLSLVIENRSEKAVSYAVEMKLPENLRFVDAGEQPSFTVKADAQSTATIIKRLKAGTVTSPMNECVKVSVRVDSHTTKILESAADIYPRIEAEKLSTPPSMLAINGAFADIPGKTCSASPLECISKFAWDENCLYMEISAKGEFSPVCPENIGSFWKNDCIEFFIDPGNTRHRDIGVEERQFFICPVGLNGGAAFGGVVVRERHGDSVDVTETKAEPMIKVACKDAQGAGYTVRCAIPWSLMGDGFRPSEGASIGMDAAITVAKLGVCHSLMGLKGKTHSPFKWGVIVLK